MYKKVLQKVKYIFLGGVAGYRMRQVTAVARIGTLGGDFFLVGLENSLYKK